WCSHVDSLAVTTFSDKSEFAKTFRNRINRLPCLKCRQDAIEYLNRNDITIYYNDPPTEYLRIYPTSKGKGLAFYVWMFHNVVNNKLGKRQMTWDEFLMTYMTESSTCTAECGVEEVKPNYNQTSVISTPITPVSLTSTPTAVRQMR